MSIRTYILQIVRLPRHMNMQIMYSDVGQASNRQVTSQHK